VLVEARNLTKFYNQSLAVDRLTFSIDRGEIVGLLGPNGAGKTTTMRMLACFLPPTDGRALVAGHDVVRDPLRVRRHVGYMPESNPLPAEARVEEYLRYRAELKGVARARRTGRIRECMEMSGAFEVRRRIIGALSRGYRQRVGLADALLADPDVLVLDEPTVGLDPNQILQTRRTIRRLGERRTILLSTHILQEVEAVCSRVLIINHGRIIMDETMEGLRRTGGATVELRGDPEPMLAALVGLEGVTEAVPAPAAAGWVKFALRTVPDADVRERVAALAAARGWPLRELASKRTPLEDVFYRITTQDEVA
jgi:ABC-2 type transport system ATP-binding protein